MRERSRAWSAAGGAVGMGGAAAFLGACCVSPLAVTLFGVSGAVTIARLAWLQPWFVLVAAMSIAFAFRWAYREGSGVCDPATNRRTRRIVWVAAIIATLLAVASFVPVYYSFV